MVESYVADQRDRNMAVKLPPRDIGCYASASNKPRSQRIDK
jgi:hypothetical protein